ncbi:hypothetical protein PINS_up019746 [Pythium insidiosum]|nr:hypothetical protein PINS_up013734 [Pythium insidiosum]GLE08503.1 hypothetical protein PINS_up019746 [Pythium insidiosum]
MYYRNIVDGERVPAILEESTKIMSDYKASPKVLNYLAGILTDLYIDLCKFRGTNVKQNLPRLYQLNEHYHLIVSSSFTCAINLPSSVSLNCDHRKLTEKLVESDRIKCQCLGGKYSISPACGTAS